VPETIDIRREMKQCPSCGQRFSADAAFCPFDGVNLAKAALETKADPLVGSTVDMRYQVLEVLGEGGMGRVFKVLHLPLKRAFAMKVLRQDLARDPQLADRFIHEARATASVRHQNVVQITDFGMLPERIPYFVMELLVGQTLRQLLKVGPVPVAYGARILNRVAHGLEAAHAAGVIHRDLKPDNVFLVGSPRVDGTGAAFETARSPTSSDVEVRIVDFGAAKIIGASRITRTGIVFGTPHYMSPEQASGQPVDHRADVYAVGVIMYEMFTGSLPFQADTYMGVLTQHIFAQPVPPSRVSTACPELGAVEEVILKCLEKKPEQRFASMSELADAIERAVQTLDRSMPRAPPDPTGGRTDEWPIAHESDAPAPPRQGGSWVWLAAALASLGLAVAVWSVVRPARSAAGPVDAVPVVTSAPPAVDPTAVPRAVEPPVAPVAPVAPAAPVATASAPVGTAPSAGAPAVPSSGRTVRRAAPRPTLPAHGAANMDDVGDPFSGHH
jgi:eukaryotic-like serine/threonine-protein kinase